MKHIIYITAGVILFAGIIVFGLSYLQAYQERATLTADLEHRTQVLEEGLKESVEPDLAAHSYPALQKLVDKFADREGLIGLVIFDSTGTIVASSHGLPAAVLKDTALATNVMNKDAQSGSLVQNGTEKIYVYADPLHSLTTVIGAFVIVQDASYIDTNILFIWEHNLFRLILQTLIFAAAIAILVRYVIFRPILLLVESMRALRTGNSTEHVSALQHNVFFMPLAAEISKIMSSLTRARTVASTEARMRLEKLDSPWTEERLKEFIKAYVKDRPIYVVSNREPYIHSKNGRGITVSMPASGMVTALEAVMAACGGMWLAQGTGNADRETADEDGKLRVPPEDPRYTLKRIWLTEEEVKGFYTGFSNEALWPLCHMAHNRPIFRKDDWTAYRKVNGMFAKSLLAEIKNIERPIILVQDFHFALLPAMIKASRPDAQVAIFWHIPMPSADTFSICPYRKEILQGMLGADIVGFHTQQFCNNFMEMVGRDIEAVIDFEQFSITSEGHKTYVKAFPISIAFTDAEDASVAVPNAFAKLVELGISTEFLGLGVDRLDYTKGILERFKGIEHFLSTYPEYVGRFTFLQIAPISREGVEKYREYNDEVTEEAKRINQMFSVGSWRPIVLEKKHYTHEELRPLYMRADVCLVTSLHDGMNLVAKEYVAARDDERGVLILSQFTGAARDLKGALLLNPYSAEETAEAIHTALIMPQTEQHRRMKIMRGSIRDYNIYRWSAELIKAVANI